MADVGIQLSLSTHTVTHSLMISHSCQPHQTRLLGMVVYILWQLRTCNAVLILDIDKYSSQARVERRHSKVAEEARWKASHPQATPGFWHQP